MRDCVIQLQYYKYSVYVRVFPGKKRHTCFGRHIPCAAVDLSETRSVTGVTPLGLCETLRSIPAQSIFAFTRA